MKTCYFCRGPVEPRRVDHMAERDGRYVLVRELPAEVCAQCGEVYLGIDSSRCIDEALRQGAKAESQIQVPVIRCA